MEQEQVRIEHRVISATLEALNTIIVKIPTKVAVTKEEYDSLPVLFEIVKYLENK